MTTPDPRITDLLYRAEKVFEKKYPGTHTYVFLPDGHVLFFQERHDGIGRLCIDSHDPLVTVLPDPNRLLALEHLPALNDALAKEHAARLDLRTERVLKQTNAFLEALEDGLRPAPDESMSPPVGDPASGSKTFDDFLRATPSSPTPQTPIPDDDLPF